ncbi:exopolysaccharide biosynthesis protein [Marinifilum breve]|uniref:Exopolysaccharide biosynthesis protein n=1 Tax=Marinifilum breve TaxID=2184082 RepID=A0A2V4A6K6_9BACT|nr:Wzz/FepE/Etk N-terminal domain-containing protein [Marinifilum breve]PXY03000.1 exopolysaccharide biosynthesis protein [Marinifilum breve]
MQEQKNITQADDEIDLIALAKTLWEGRKTVIKTTIIFMLIGLFVAIFSEKEYTASCTMVPQSAEGGSKLGGSLGGLAAMAGINLGSIGGGSDIPPMLYPRVVNSIPFQKEMMKTPLSIEGQNEKVTFSHYYEEIYKPGVFGYLKKYTIGLPKLIIKAIRGKSIEKQDEKCELLTISRKENGLIKTLNEQVKIDINDKEGYIALTARMPEAKAAAELANKAQELLQETITEFKIQKAKDQLSFIEKRYTEKEEEARKAQRNLAQFIDRNKNVSTATAQTELDRLKAEYNLIYGVYSELAKQLESQKIQVEEDTPVFTVVEPVTVPIDKASPNRPLILIIWTMFGGIIGIGMVFWKEFYGKIKLQWNNDN